MKATSNNTRFALSKTPTRCFGFGSEATNLCREARSAYRPSPRPSTFNRVGWRSTRTTSLPVASLFTGDVCTEATAPVGPMKLPATGTIQPAQVGFLAVDSSGNLYLPEWHNVAARYGGQPPDYCTYYSCQGYETTRTSCTRSILPVARSAISSATTSGDLIR
jgi:hypothetical protein